jgi:CheY-like chemotaxis protein
MMPTVLLVDDDPEVIHTFSRWLQLEGYRIRTAANGEDALAQLDGVAAVIVDARMPIVDGAEFVRRVRAHDQRLPIAIVTGDYLIDEAILSEFSLRNVRVLYKPLWLDDLIALTLALVNREVAA